MNRSTTHIKLAGATLAVAGALVLPAGVQAGSGGEAAAGAVAVEQQHSETASQPGGLDRQDAAIALAILAGILVLAVRGDAVVGAAIGAAAAVVGAAVRLVTGTPKRGPGWSDWPGLAAARVEQQGAHRPLSRRRRRHLVPSLADDERAGNTELH